MIYARTYLGMTVRRCRDAILRPAVHDPHSQYDHATGTSTWCPGLTTDEVAALEWERNISQSDD